MSGHIGFVARPDFSESPRKVSVEAGMRDTVTNDWISTYTRRTFDYEDAVMRASVVELLRMQGWICVPPQDLVASN